MDSTRVAWVTGASRGVGRGIAQALGAAGWTVWVTARSSAAGTTSHLPGTVEETAAVVEAAGGVGVARVCDHRDEGRVAAVAAEIAAAGPLDLLVNNAWAGYERLNAGAWTEWNAPFWQQPVELFDAMFAGGVRAHYLASRICAPLLIESGGLLVTVSMDVGRAHDPGHGVAYSAAKAADDRLVEAISGQLAGRASAVALYPGLVRTEGVLQFAAHLDLGGSQSPAGVGRVVAALAADPERHVFDGRAVDVAALADRYGVDVVT